MQNIGVHNGLGLEGLSKARSHSLAGFKQWLRNESLMFAFKPDFAIAAGTFPLA
jgi:hypothetical protein